MVKIAIQGHPTRGNDIIQILEDLGGKNKQGQCGDDCCSYYYIGHDNIIYKTYTKWPDFKYYTLEEFEKEFPFKIGDKVIDCNDDEVGTIIGFINHYSKLRCIVDFIHSGRYYMPTETLKLYKEMEQRTITFTLNKAKEWYKKGGEFKEVVLQVYSEEELNTKEWIDLGLPSGTLWCNTNEEGYYSWDEMTETFDKESLPKLTDFAELYDYCSWQWDDKRKGMVVIGRNGNSIFFPASGYCRNRSRLLYGVGAVGYYWSFTPFGSYACYLFFSSNGNVHPTGSIARAYGQSVRCIKRK